MRSQVSDILSSLALISSSSSLALTLKAIKSSYWSETNSTDLVLSGDNTLTPLTTFSLHSSVYSLNSFKTFSSFTLSSATLSLSSLFAFLNFCSLFVMILERVTTRNSLDVTAQRYHRQGPSYSLNLGKKAKWSKIWPHLNALAVTKMWVYFTLYFTRRGTNKWERVKC